MAGSRLTSTAWGCLAGCGTRSGHLACWPKTGRPESACGIHPALGESLQRHGGFWSRPSGSGRLSAPPYWLHWALRPEISSSAICPIRVFRRMLCMENNPTRAHRGAAGLSATQLRLGGIAGLRVGGWAEYVGIARRVDVGERYLAARVGDQGVGLLVPRHARAEPPAADGPNRNPERRSNPRLARPFDVLCNRHSTDCATSFCGVQALFVLFP